MHPSLLPDIEAQLLGVLLNHPPEVPATEGAYTLPVCCFGDGRHVTIYDAIQALYGNNKPVGVLPVLGELKKANTITQAGGFDYIAGLAAAPGMLANIRTYIAELKAAGRARQRVTVGKRLASADMTEDADELVNEATAALMDPTFKANTDEALDGRIQLF